MPEQVTNTINQNQNTSTRHQMLVCQINITLSDDVLFSDHSGLTLDEAQQILNISKLDKEEAQSKFDHLFKVNEKSNGGSFYLQSKVFRAKERVDQEFEAATKRQQKEEPSGKKPSE